MSRSFFFPFFESWADCFIGRMEIGVIGNGHDLHIDIFLMRSLCVFGLEYEYVAGTLDSSGRC